MNSSSLDINKVYCGSWEIELKKWPDNYFDSCVTDPPWAISFMNKHWDYELPSIECWAEIFRVLKPGSHILVCCGTRTQHRMVCNIEDAGFEIRDVLTHHYASGFPKSMNISKQIDKEAGVERKVIGSKGLHKFSKTRERENHKYGADKRTFEEADALTAPTTEDAKQWDGYGTAVKPATEFWTLARKPISEATVSANVLKWGTGALNIDGCRVEFLSDSDKDSATFGTRTDIRGGNFGAGNGIIMGDKNIGPNPKGRFPTNLIFSHHENCRPIGLKKVSGTLTVNGNAEIGEQSDRVPLRRGTGIDRTDENGLEVVDNWQCVDGCPIKMLDEQSGILQSGVCDPEKKYKSYGDGIIYGTGGMHTRISYGDIGSASRFFYCAKPSPSEKDKGVEDFFWKKVQKHLVRISKEEYDSLPEYDRISGNIHPTVKSVDLLSYLVKLITPKRGLTLDPFMGSGTSCIGAKMELINYVGIDLLKDHCDIAEARIASWNPPKYIEQTLF